MKRLREILEAYPSDPNISKQIRDNIARGMPQKQAFAIGWSKYNKNKKPINTIKSKEDNSYYRAKEGLNNKNDL